MILVIMAPMIASAVIWLARRLDRLGRSMVIRIKP